MKLTKFLFLSLLATLFVSCGDDDEGTTTEPVSDQTKSGELTADETWTSDQIYHLDGKVIVADGVTLTIEAGTIIKGMEGQETLASALVVDQGGTLIAEGTASNPIIFTSELDNIEVGETEGTNLTTADKGLWGGVIILGYAPISVSGDVETAQIEGIAATESYGQYGGNNPADNSGSLSYISIRHGGVTIGDDNEINGLSLGGVGSGTSIDHIEIVGNQDDGIEFFGGTVSVSYAIIYDQGDDGFDTDQAWAGTLDNGMVILGSGSGTALELDGPEGSATTEDGHTIKNVTLIGAGDSKMADCRDGLIANLENILAYNFSASGTVKINGADAATELSADRITFSNWEIVLPSGITSVDELISGDYTAGDETKFTDNATAIADAASATVGATPSGYSWTYAASKSAF
ncbi:hypothetical protein [Neptunitalea chrysea]|nr:hypothetical protein [Neptunitalea chrysea]